MKPHRQFRHSRRVSSETGAAIAAMIGEPGPTRYGRAKDEIVIILRRLPPEQRVRLLAEVVFEITKEGKRG